MSQYFILIPVVSLLLLGSIIALRSGAVGMDLGGNVRVIASNFPALLIRVVVFLVTALVVSSLLNAPSLFHLGGR